MREDSSEELLARLRDDLRSAMRGRESSVVSVLRGLIAAIDNAQAVPVGDMHAKYVVHEFGDKSVEVPRKALTGADLDSLLAAEIETRNSAAEQYRRLNRHDRADELLREAGVIGRYRSAAANP